MRGDVSRDCLVGGVFHDGGCAGCGWERSTFVDA